MKPVTVARLTVLAHLAPPILCTALAVWIGVAAALAGLDGSVEAPLALAGVAGCALAIVSFTVWAVAIVRDLRRLTRPTHRPM